MKQIQKLELTHRLRQMTDASTYENKNTQTIKKNMKNDQEFLSSEMDLLEQVFKIPDDPKLKQSSKEKSHKHVHDETMATDLSSITLIEFYETKTVDYANVRKINLFCFSISENILEIDL